MYLLYKSVSDLPASSQFRTNRRLGKKRKEQQQRERLWQVYLVKKQDEETNKHQVSATGWKVCKLSSQVKHA